MDREQYGRRIDAGVYGCDAPHDYTRADWIKLALAALDQAGVNTRQLHDAYMRGMRGKGTWDDVVEELEP